MASSDPGRRPRPALRDDERDQEREGAAEVEALFDALTAGLAADDAALDDDRRARRLLAYLLEFHRREDKSMWWEFFHRCGLSEEELVADRATLGALTCVGEAGQVKRSVFHRYRFPDQPHEIEVGDSPKNPATAESEEQRRGFCGKVVALDDVAATIDLKRGRASSVPHPRALVPLDNVGAGVLRDSLLGLAREVASGGFAADSPRRAAFDLLRRVPPRVLPAPRAGTEPPPATGPNLVGEGETPLDAVRRIAPRLDRSVLPVQGPPGSGKTYTGAQMILDLLADRKRVGVTANSHKVISNLLGAVCRAAGRRPGASVHGGCEPDGPSAGPPSAVRGIQKANPGDGCPDERIVQAASNEAVADALAAGEANLAAGTAWLWAREELAGAVDVLVIDEAGQMSLANTLAASQAARSVVLLGDPRQLDQPIQGIHPPGADVSALGHLLGEAPTIEPSRGIFLDHTWRMHPAVCAFTTEQFYAGRLGSRPELARQQVVGPGPLAGSGLRFVAVEHAGNTNASTEEAARVAALLRELLDAGAAWVDRDGVRRPLTLEDILVVAPYNAQVATLLGAPGRCARRHGGQVPGPGGAGRHLLAGDLHPRRRAARHGVSLQPEPAQRRHVARTLRRGHRRQPGAPGPGLPDPGADASGEPVLPLPRAGRGCSGHPRRTRFRDRRRVTGGPGDAATLNGTRCCDDPP